MKGIISIFALPQEIEDLAGTLEKLKRNSVYITDKFQYKVEVTMCLSDKLTDWKEMQLPKSYFEDRANELCAKYLDWCSYECVIEETTKILGCVSQRRESLKNNQDADFFIWLDCDIVFKDTTKPFRIVIIFLIAGLLGLGQPLANTVLRIGGI